MWREIADRVVVNVERNMDLLMGYSCMWLDPLSLEKLSYAVYMLLQNRQYGFRMQTIPVN